MCFSANASFIASGVLFLISILALKESSKKQIFFALIPLLFSIQQFTEGLLWLSLQGAIPIKFAVNLTYAFLFFAIGIWPIWIPLSILLLEKQNIRKILLSVVLLLGFILSLFGLYWLFKNGAAASILNHHICYKFNIPKTNIDFILYIFSISSPFFITSQRRLKIFGLLLLFSLAISYLFYLKSLTSVWCFFAAILSVFVYWFVKNK